jgi:hypothetical protein
VARQITHFKEIAFMKVKDETIRVPSHETGGDHTPRKLTPMENVILTAKILAGFAILGGLLWWVSLWKTGQ